MERYSIDGGKTWLELPPDGLRIISDSHGDEEINELHINCTSEGVIMDLWNGGTANEPPNNLGTSSQTYEEIAAQLTR